MIHFETSSVNGIPCQSEVTINFGELSIKLSGQKYFELVNAISEKTATDLDLVQEGEKRFWERQTMVGEMMKDIRSVFFNDVDGDIFFRRAIRDIDEKKLTAVLEKHKALMGLQDI